MIILDTNVLSEIFKPSPDGRVMAWIESLTDDVAITAITLAELLAGLASLPEGRRRSELTAAIEKALQPYHDTRSILAFDEVAAQRHADVTSTRGRAGSPISTADAQIAAICLAHGAVCATRNVRDFEHTGVELLNPWEE